MWPPWKHLPPPLSSDTSGRGSSGNRLFQYLFGGHGYVRVELSCPLGLDSCSPPVSGGQPLGIWFLKSRWARDKSWDSF